MKTIPTTCSTCRHFKGHTRPALSKCYNKPHILEQTGNVTQKWVVTFPGDTCKYHAKSEAQMDRELGF